MKKKTLSFDFSNTNKHDPLANQEEERHRDIQIFIILHSLKTQINNGSLNGSQSEPQKQTKSRANYLLKKKKPLESSSNIIS